MKKVLSLLLVAVMSIGLLSGCGSKSASVAVDESGRPTDHVTLHMYFEGSNVTDDSDVMEQVNKYLDEKLNVTLEPIWGTWGDFDTNVVLSMAAHDDVDIYFTCSWTSNEYNVEAKKGSWLRLDDPKNNLIEKYGQDVWNILPEVLKEGATIDGTQGRGVYAIGCYKDIAAQYCWDVNVDVLEKCGWTLDDIKNRDFYTFDEIFADVKAKMEAETGEPFYPLCPEGANLTRMVTNAYQVTGDTTNAIAYVLNPENVEENGAYGLQYVSKFETEEYKKFIKQVRDYYLKGYIDPATENSNEATDIRYQHQDKGDYLIGCQSYAFGYEAQASAERGYHIEYVGTTDPFTNTETSQGAMYAISCDSKNPERAMMLLNLLNTDEYLMTLMNFGIEGVHYNKNDLGEVVFTEKRELYTPWTNGMGNVTLLPPQKGQGSDFVKDFKEFYGAAGCLPDLGFVFDSEPVVDQSGAVEDAVKKYDHVLEIGAVDPDSVYDEWIADLKANGLDDVLAEANKQLDAWAKEAGKK